MPEYAVFCSKCGARIERAEEQTTVLETPPAEEQTVEEQPIEEQPIEARPAQTRPVESSAAACVWGESFAPAGAKRKKRLWLIAAAAAVVVAAACAALWYTGVLTSARAEQTAAVYALRTDDGTAYLPRMDGETIEIRENVASAVLTPDRENVVVLLRDGTLYVTDVNQKEKKTISNHCVYYSTVRNDGIVYEDKNGTRFRGRFEDASSVELGENVRVSVAEHRCALLFALETGEVYSLPADANKAVLLAEYDVCATPLAISDNGQIAAWLEDEHDQLVIRDGEERFAMEIADMEKAKQYCFPSFSADQELLVVGYYFAETFWIYRTGGEPVEVKLSSRQNQFFLMTDKDALYKTDTDEVDAIYLCLAGGIGQDLYHVALDGTSTRVCSEIWNYDIASGAFVYLGEDRVLRCAELNGAQLSNEQELDRNVERFYLSQNGTYVYYIKKLGDKGVLYGCKLGAGEPVRISEDISCELDTFYGVTYWDLSSDGKSVYYLKETEPLSDGYRAKGTLMKWSYGDDAPTEIARGVVSFSLNSGLLDGWIDDECVTFLTYDSVDQDGRIHGDWLCFDGARTTCIAAGVID